MLALALGFASSVAWGLADFLGGLKSRRLPLLNVLLGSQAAGLVLITAIVAARGEGPPGGDFAIFALFSGLAGLTGLAAFYRGLAVGNMGIVAPISATAAAIPLVVAIATGDRPTAVESCGLALSLSGVVLASREEVGGGTGPGRLAQGAGLAIVSAVGFGFFFLCMDRASDGDILWAILINRVTGVTLIVAATLALRVRIEASATDFAGLALIGTLDLTANMLFGLAATKGLLSLVAVLGSLYPITTIALARVVLGERPHRVAQIGVAVAMVGVVLIAAG
jgi:drug/metabolite transporter (DMT)-like permease